jgi:hypothetical protein
VLIIRKIINNEIQIQITAKQSSSGGGRLKAQSMGVLYEQQQRHRSVIIKLINNK